MEALPLSALATPALLANLRGRSSAAMISLNCTVTKVFYLGDEGGITCHVIFDEEEKDEVFLVSITQLAFDLRLSVAREIAAYQKHRIKRVRMGRKARVGGDLIVIPHAQSAPADSGRVRVFAERKVVLGLEPAMICCGEFIEWSVFNHRDPPASDLCFTRRGMDKGAS
jgi:hypothetical protein